jgi:tetratricopeptide (TPR) repeat protein
VLIDFDAIDDEEPPVDEARESVASSNRPPASEPSAPVAETPPSVDAPRETPAGDVLAEIEALIEQGSLPEAERRLEALETLGWGGDGVATLRARVDGAKPQASTSTELSELDTVSLGEGDEADDDLSAITAALESELFADDTEPVVAEPESEQSLEDVFAAFKAQVEEEVESDDYRTHYDLGIAYKEMGLLDEAVSEFERSMGSTELGRESYTMLALCHRERDDLAAAADAYRKAIERSDGDSAMQLRYELADLLVAAGDREGALDQFRHLAGSDPGFRDVRDRLAELESFAT